MTRRPIRLWTILPGALFVGAIGCSAGAPAAPSAPAAPVPVSSEFVVGGIGPVAGRPAEPTVVRIRGDGFQPGATVSFDGRATPATVESGHSILTTAPPHPAGAIDVVVTNPDGRVSRLEKAFTYVEGLLTSGDITLEPGGSVTATLDPFERTCTFDDTACRQLFIRAPAGTIVEVDLVSLARQDSVGLFDPMPVRGPTQFPKHLTVTGAHPVWIVGEWSVFTVTARLVK